MNRASAYRNVIYLAAAVALPAYSAVAQSATDGQSTQQPPNVPPPGEPRAQEQLPEAPAEEQLKSPPPIEKSEPPKADTKPAPAPMPNTLPPAKQVEQPKVPNT